MSPLSAVHLVDEGVYLVESQHFELEVGNLPTPKYKPFTVTSLESIMRVERKSGPILRRLAKYNNDESIDEADYQSQLAILRSVGFEEDGDLRWPNLEAEFNYRRFVEKWTTIERGPEIIERTPVEFKVVEVRTSSGDPDIVSMWNAPQAIECQRALFSFNRTAYMMGVARDLCARAGLPLEIPSHSGLRFAKIYGDYAFNDDKLFDEIKTPFIGTLEQCKAEKQARYRNVANVVERFSLKRENKPLVNAGSVILSLDSIRKQVASLAVRKATDVRDRDAICKRIFDLMGTIQSSTTGGNAASSTPEKP